MSTKQRPRPLKINIPIPGGWNPDATESSIAKSEFIEGRNMRKAKSDEWEARSGIVEQTFSGHYTPVCAAEYRLDNAFARVLVYEDFSDGLHHRLRARVVDLDTGLDVIVPGPPYMASQPDLGFVPYEAFAVQWNTFLIVTVYNFGVFALSPNTTDLSTWNTPVELGKLLTPSPNVDAAIAPNVGVGWNRFKEDVTGDLLVNEYIVPIPHTTDFKPLTNLGSGDPVRIRLKIEAPYKRVAGSTAIIATNLLRQSEVDKSDADKNIFPRETGVRQHLHKRGWFYRFVMKSRYTDIKGQKITYYHEPSVDLYVPDNDYAPPFVLWYDGIVYSVLGALHSFGVPGWPAALNFYNHLPGPAVGANPDLTESPAFPPAQHGGLGSPLTVTDPDFVRMVKAYRAYFHDTSTSGTSDAVDPFLATSIAFSFSAPVSPDYFLYQSAYEISVPVSELLSAPQAIFNWADFAGLPPDVYEIEVHRTAYIDSPNFAPSVYGQAGVIKKDGTFTDDVKDTALDFNGNINRNTGYLQSEYSAKVVRVYSGNIRLGNITDTLKIRTPSNVVQAFDFVPADPIGAPGLINRSNLIGVAVDLTVIGADGFSQVVFGYQYVDSDDNASDLTVIGGINSTTHIFNAVDTGIASPSPVGVAFTFPHGYNDTIQSIYVFEGRWIPTAGLVLGHREWHRIAVVPTLAQSSLLPPETDSGHLVYLGLSDPDWSAAPVLSAAVPVIAKDSGATVWSQNSDMNHWPPENYELEHQFAPITAIGNSSGPALIHTDQSMNMTDFGVQQRWEEIHDSVGCIGRFAACKVGRVEFFLSAIGMQMSEGQGLRTFPASVQTVVIKYLNEYISGVPRLTNARRASLGWLGQRNELHLRFPSSADLGGTLPAIDIVFRLFYDYGEYSPKDVQNYRFDLYPTGDPGTQTFFISSPATGRLWALSAKIVPLVPGPGIGPGMSLIEMDVPTVPWAGDAYLTLPISLGLAETKKELSELLFTADADCLITVSTGMKRTDGLDQISTSEDLVRGPLKPGCEIIPLELAVELDPMTGLPVTGLPIIYSQSFRHEISYLMENIGDRVPCIRIHTAVNTGFGGCIATGNHLFRLKSMEVEATIAEEPDVRHV